MKRFVKPSTKNTRQSRCELLLSQGMASYVGNAEWFIYACAHQFLDAVTSLKPRFESDSTDPFIWFDLFSVSQHKSKSRPFEFWNTAFLSSIASIGRVIMLVQRALKPFDDADTVIIIPSHTRLDNVIEGLVCL